MKKIFLSLAVLVLFVTGVFCKDLPGKTSHYVLENGLNVFITENHSVPLVFVEVAVRAGAITQTKENAGLFHLYEHMMFKGNTKYKSASEVQKAISDMGVASWNGSTGIECVNYFFTIPKDKLQEGLEFWSYAIREPLIEPKELENEKKVVLSEITGNQNDPGRRISSYKSLLLFPNAPYQLDPAGDPSVVSNATVEDIRKIQKEYYVSNNAAVFVGGDLDTEKTLEMIKSIYGSWQRGDVPNVTVEQTSTPLDKPKYIVVPYDEISPQIAQVQMVYRGPDSDFDVSATYSADMLSNYLNNPESTFKNEMISDEKLMIPNQDYIWAGYSTQRRNGTITTGALLLSPENSLAERIQHFYEKFNSIMTEYSKSKKIISNEMKESILLNIRDDDILSSETTGGILGSLQYWWADCGVEYYKGYSDNMAKVNNKAISKMLSKYVVNKNPLIVVMVNPEVYESQKEEFAKLGFIEMPKENIFWWSK